MARVVATWGQPGGGCRAALAALARQVSWVAGVGSTLDAALLGLVASCTGIGPNAAASAACAIVFVR